MDNASDTRQIREAHRAAKAAQASGDRVLLSLMSGPEGRAYFFQRLERSFIFSTPFTGDNNRTNFNLGIQNAGLQDLADLMRVCPNEFISMMREAADKETANGRRTSSSNARDIGSGPGGDRSNGNGGDNDYSGGGIRSEYDPHASGGDDAADGTGED